MRTRGHISVGAQLAAGYVMTEAGPCLVVGLEAFRVEPGREFVRAHSARLQRRDTLVQVFAGLGMAVCLVLIMVIVMGGQG